MNLNPMSDVQTHTVGKNIGIFESLDSTNSHAKRMIGFLNDGHVIAAREQLSGRGRQGKSFYSPENGGLYMTIVVKDKKATEDELFTVKACLAVCRGIDRLCGTDEKSGVGIKWVNDIYFGGKKLCGILCERFADHNGDYCVAAGFGINFKLEHSNIPSELRKTVTSLFDITKKRYDPMTLCAYICEEVEKLIYDSVYTDEEIISMYKRRSVVIGKEISIITEDNPPMRAAALDICPDGALLVRTQDGFTKKLCGGEISIKLKK